MSRVVACFKWVTDESQIVVRPDLTVDFSAASKIISNYDRQVIEQAVLTAKTLGATATGLTFADSAGSASLKEALSRGLDDCFFVNEGDALSPDGSSTAKGLAAQIKKLDDVKLVICGEGASDTLARQTASRIGAFLDLPVVTAVAAMRVEGDELVMDRKLADCTETVRVAMPAVVSVLPEINQPPLPGLKAIMAAKKKPATETPLAELPCDAAPKARLVSEQGYIMVRKNVMLSEGEASEKVDRLYESLKKEGVI